MTLAPRENRRASATIDGVPRTDAIEIETETEIARARVRLTNDDSTISTSRWNPTLKKCKKFFLNILSVLARVRTLLLQFFSKVTTGETFEPPLIERCAVCLVQISLATP